jgi:hypothetical protein
MISLQHGVDEVEQRTTGGGLYVSIVDEVLAAAEAWDYRPEGFLHGGEEESGENRHSCNLDEGIFLPLDLGGGISN